MHQYICFNTQNYIYPFQNLSLVFILKIFLKFRKCQPRHSYKIYSYKEKRVYSNVIVGVKSLFTSIPLQLALQCTETAIQQSTVKLPSPTEDIMDLLNLCFTSTYFQYNAGRHYKQLHGTAMGSPVSVVVAEINCDATCEGKRLCNLSTNDTALVTLR